MKPRLIMLVLDGFSPRHCTPAITPNLVALGETGAWARGGGRAMLPSATYPNHASLVTGLDPLQHGIFANNTLTADGIRPAQHVGARGVTFLDAARAAGLSTGVVTGDAKILGVVGARRCDAHWPPDGVVPPGTPLVRGYAHDDVTFAAFLDLLDRDTDVMLCQLDNTDGMSHDYGPDSPEAIATHAEADRRVRTLVERLSAGPRWRETILAVISDHSHTTTDPGAPPINLHAALRGAGIAAEVVEEGSGALIRSAETDAAHAVVTALDGIAGVSRFTDRVLYVHARRGRGFNTVKPLPRGIHGCPETTATLCLATGGHPGIAMLGDAFARETPTTATLAPMLTAAVGLAWDR